MSNIDYTYLARLDRVVDGDTVDMFVDLGFKTIVHQRFRLLGVNTPELRSKDIEEREAAHRAKEFVEQQLESAELIIVQSTKTGKYGRYIGDITYKSNDGFWYNLSKTLIEKGFGKEYASK